MMHKVKDLYGGIYDSADGAIIKILSEIETATDTYLYGALMEKAGITPELADYYYCNHYSPSKCLSPSVEKIATTMLGLDWDDITSGDFPGQLAGYMAFMFDQKYRNKYQRYYDMIDVEYSPIENYDRYEDLNRRTNDAGNMSNSVSGSNTGTQTTVNQIEGFNSTTFNDSDKATRTDNLANSETTTGSHVNSGQEIATNHIHGNIGVTTAEQMLRGYTDFWSEFNLLDIICHDIDTLLTTQTY